MFLTAEQARAMCRHGLTEVPENRVIRDATILYDFISITIMPVIICVQSHITAYINSWELDQKELAVIQECFDLSPQHVKLLFNTVIILSKKAGHRSLDGTDEALLNSIRALAGVLQVRSVAYRVLHMQCDYCCISIFYVGCSLLAVYHHLLTVSACANYCMQMDLEEPVIIPPEPLQQLQPVIIPPEPLQPSLSMELLFSPSIELPAFMYDMIQQINDMPLHQPSLSLVSDITAVYHDIESGYIT
jgi:hypothetical protein